MRCCGVSRHALSAGMYASQIWSTQFLKHDNVFSNLFAGRAHGVFNENFGELIYSYKLVCASEMRAGTLAILLVHVKFWNRMVEPNSNTLPERAD